MRQLISTPLPSLSALFCSFFSPIQNETEIAKTWCRQGDKGFLFSRSSWSLQAIAAWRRKLTGRNPVIWIPDYFCNSALTPLRESDVCLIFYPIDSQMNPSAEACQRLLANNPPDLFVLVHYFGQPAKAPWLVSFCKKNDTWLIEDAAHVLKPAPGVGEIGDLVLYSPHKHLPIPDGSVLVLHAEGPFNLSSNPTAMDAFKQVRSSLLDKQGYTIKPTLIWFIKRFLQLLGYRRSQSPRIFRADVKPSNNSFPHPKVSGLALRLLKWHLPQLPMIAYTRKKHQRLWEQVLKWSRPGKQQFSSILNEDNYNVPYQAGFIGESEDEIEVFFKFLQQCMLPVTTWPDLPPEVLENKSIFTNANTLRYRSFFLPVHQALSDSEIMACGKRLLSAATANWQVRMLNRQEWDTYWPKCTMTNMLQAWEYGSAKEQAEGWKAHRIIVSDQEGKPVGLAQVLTRGLPLLGGVARLNRGPLLVGDWPACSEVPLKLAVLRVILRESRRQRWWVLRVAPELPKTDEADQGLQALGFRRLDVPAWASGRLSLKADEQVLLMGLKGKWRNTMRKALKLGVKVSCSLLTKANLEVLIHQYGQLQQDRAFSGLSKLLIRNLAVQSSNRYWRFNLLVAYAPDGSPLGVLVSVRICDTSNYLIGATNDQGRKMQANSAMLWSAILQAKADGCAWFDIGGLNEATPKGIVDFKRGINAKPYALVGEWRAYQNQLLKNLD
jgi:hypothetical protein